MPACQVDPGENFIQFGRNFGNMTVGVFGGVCTHMIFWLSVAKS